MNILASRSWRIVGLALGVALLAYACALGAAFTLDDYYWLGLPAVVDPDGWVRSFDLLQTRPLSVLTFWASYQASGADAAAWRILSLILHAANVLLLRAALRRMVPEDVGTWAAVLFALHPVLAESVLYVSARSTLLATLFCLLALWWWSKGRHGIAVAAFALGVLAKEECVAFPLLLGWLHFRTSRDARGWRAIALMLLVSVLAGLRVLFAASILKNTGVAGDAGVSVFEYFAQQSLALLLYAGFTLVPFTLSLEPLGRAPLWVGLLGWVALLSLLWRVRTRVPERVKLWGVGALLLLAPSSTIFAAADLAAGRRLYLPMVAVAVVLADVLVRYPAWRRWYFTALVIGLGASVWIWADTARLWQYAAWTAPGSARAQVQLARAQGPEQGEITLRRFLERGQESAAIRNELGALALQQGRFVKALQEFGKANALEPGSPVYRANRGLALGALGQTEAALRDLQAALSKDPCLLPALRGMRKWGRGPIVVDPRCGVPRAQVEELR